MSNENKNNTNNNFESMSYEEELIFGLKRWLKKVIDYLNNRSPEEFFSDNLSFDAVCYCILVVSEIASKINEIDSLKAKYKDINFDEIALLYDKTLKGDNYNLSFIYELISGAIPYLYNMLIKIDNK